MTVFYAFHLDQTYLEFRREAPLLSLPGHQESFNTEAHEVASVANRAPDIETLSLDSPIQRYVLHLRLLSHRMTALPIVHHVLGYRGTRIYTRG